MRRRWLLAMAMGLALMRAGSARALEPCDTNCAVVHVDNGQGTPGGQVSLLTVSFTQGPDDGTPNEGNDEVAAVAMTIGIPGTGDGAPLQFSAADCADADGDGVIDGVRISPALADNFRVVVENADCVNRNRCLCPGDGQTRDDFVNIVVFGPKDLPEQGSGVTIEPLPSGSLFSLRLQVAPGTAAPSQIPVHVFAETDDGGKPQFAANLSIGDVSAVDETADRGADKSKVKFEDAVVNVNPPVEGCLGDCNSNNTVAINELITGVNIALGSIPMNECQKFDVSGDGSVEIDELIAGVNNSLNGCP